MLDFESRERGLCDIVRKGCYKIMGRKKVSIGDGMFYSSVCLGMNIGLISDTTMAMFRIMCG